MRPRRHEPWRPSAWCPCPPGRSPPGQACGSGGSPPGRSPRAGPRPALPCWAARDVRRWWRRSGTRPRRPGRPPFRRLRRIRATARNRSPRSRGAVGRCLSCVPLPRRSASGDLEAELSVPDPDQVTGPELRLAVELPRVQERAIGGIQVLDEIPAATIEDAGVESGCIAVVEPDVGIGRPAQRDAAEEVEVVSLVEAPALLDDEERVGGIRLASEDLVVTRLETGRGGAAQIPQGHPSDPEQEQIEDGEEAELERYG